MNFEATLKPSSELTYLQLEYLLQLQTVQNCRNREEKLFSTKQKRFCLSVEYFKYLLVMLYLSISNP